MKQIISFFIAIIPLFADLTFKDIQTIKYRVKILESKTSGDINAENSRGYLGRYQFGAAALVAVGLIKREKYIKATYFDKKSGGRKWRKGISNKSFLAIRSNWKLSRGKYSFLGNELLQENAMNELIRQNYNYLQKANLNLSKEELIGFLMAAHFGGFANALKYAKNKTNFQDANGVSISKYYKAGIVKLSKKEQQEIERLTKKYLGGKYLWGGTNPNGFDCSGYVQFIYRKKGIYLPRTAYAQSKVGKTVSIKNLQKGDLLFFLTDKTRGIPVTHVGVYLENGKFIHAASKKQGIIISCLADYKSRFVIAKRVLKPINGIKYANAKANVLDVNFFKPVKERAIMAPTKVTMRSGFKYQLVNGKYLLKGEYSDEQ